MSDAKPKKCNRCGQERPLTAEHWYFEHGRAKAPCRLCRKNKVPAEPPIQDTVSLDLGNSTQLSRNRERLIRKLVAYANDDKSKHHEWAFKILAPHLIPKTTAPRAGPATPAAPSRGVTINVQATGKKQAAATPVDFPDVDPLS